MTATTRRAALAALASASALAVPSALVGATSVAIAPLSAEFRTAIDAHQLAWANVEAQPSEDEEAFEALSDLEGTTDWKLVETPCATDADFLAKISYLLRHEQRQWGEMLLSYDGQYGALAFAIELHLGERDEWRGA